MNRSDAVIVADLAARVAEHAASERMADLRRQWAAHNSLRRRGRPLVTCYLCAAWLEAIPESELTCTDEFARSVERALRQQLYHADVIGDDWVMEPWFEVQAVHQGPDYSHMWGVDAGVRTVAEGGSFMFQPQIRDEEDIERLIVPDWRVDEEATARELERHAELLGDALPVVPHYGRLSGPWLSYWGAYLRGLEQMVLDTIERPEWLHRLMRFIAEATAAHLLGLEADGRLQPNDNGYRWHCDDLPQPDYSGRARLRDMWTAGDAQEFTMVSPAMQEEFLLRYQAPVCELFGLTQYGCCENQDGRIELLKRHVPNLRRVTISPWSSLRYAVEQCGSDYVMEIRPDQTQVLFGWDEAQMRADCERIMTEARGCVFDLALVGLETLHGQPQRLQQWTRAAIETGEKMQG